MKDKGYMKKSKDILFLCQFFYPEYVSSATLPYDTAVALKNAGYTVDALCGYPREYTADTKIPRKESVDGIRIKRVKYVQMGRKSFLGRLVNYFSFTFTMMLHLFEMAKYRAVVVYSNPPILPWVASWAKLLFKVKLVFVAYDLYPEIATKTETLREGNIICRLMDHINKCVYRRADSVVALSEEMREYIIAHREINPDRVHVIHNWYEDKQIKGNEAEENSFSELTKGRFVVSYFGNMGTAQDMETILEAMCILKDDPDVCFLFAGHGNKLAQLKQAVEEKNLQNVYVFEFLHGKEFQDALRISSCALVSLTEGLTGLCVPSKTYSYMMQGLPLLAVMDESDIVSDIESGAGMWVRNGDSGKLAECVRLMKNDSGALAKMRQTCREIYLENYTTEICTKEYVHLFEKLL